jgi:hypothetical protein
VEKLFKRCPTSYRGDHACACDCELRYRRCNSDPGRRLKSDPATRLDLAQLEGIGWLEANSGQERRNPRKLQIAV